MRTRISFAVVIICAFVVSGSTGFAFADSELAENELSERAVSLVAEAQEAIRFLYDSKQGTFESRIAADDRLVQLRKLFLQIGPPAVTPLLEAPVERRYHKIWEWQQATVTHMGDTALPELREALKDPRSHIRRRAIWCLAYTGSPTVVEPILAALKDPSEEVREIAAHGLAFPLPDLLAIRQYPPLGSHPEVLPALLEALPEHPQLISHALGRCGDRRATEPLLKLLKGLGSEEIDIRRKVLRALGELGDPRAIPILIQEMQSSEERIRGMAQSALCKIGAPAADAVIDFLDHPDPELRQAALWMLAGIGVPSGAEQRVFACLDDINPEVQSWAAWTMFHMDPDAAAPVLLDHLASAPKSADEPYQKQRTSLAQSLAYLGDPRAIDPLTAILTDPDEDKSVRGFAVRGLISLEAPGLEEVLAEILTDPGQPKGLQIDAIRKLHLLPGDPGTLLLKVLKNIPDPEVGRMAAYQLGRLKDRRAVQPLMEAVRTHRNAEEHSKEEWLVKAAIHALGEIGDSTATPVLMDVLTNATDTNKRVIGDKAASALGKIRDPRTRETLSRLLQKEEQGTWQYSVLGLALGAAGDPAAIPILKQRLKHRGHGDGLSPKGPHYHHTEDAAQVLARFGEAGFMVLMEALDWRHGHTADYACLALAEMHDARALEPIAKLLQHRYYRTRHHAAIALGILGEPDALPYLRKAVKDPDAYVRVGAAEALWRLGDKEYLSVIGDALQNAPGACAEAAHALARIADPRARSLLHDAAKNKDFRIHRPAKEALVALARSEAVQPEQPDE